MTQNLSLSGEVGGYTLLPTFVSLARSVAGEGRGEGLCAPGEGPPGIGPLKRYAISWHRRGTLSAPLVRAFKP